MRRIRAMVQLIIPQEIWPNLTNQEQWMGLCESAYDEHDHEKMGRRFLTEYFAFWKNNRCGLTQLPMSCPHDTPALI
jgi:hypothetical protein